MYLPFFLRTWQRSPVTPGGHMHLKVLSPLSTHVPLLTQGSLEQGSKPSKYIIKVKEPPSKLELTTKHLSGTTNYVCVQMFTSITSLGSWKWNFSLFFLKDRLLKNHLPRSIHFRFALFSFRPYSHC